MKQTREDGSSLADYRFGERSGKFAPGLEALTRLLARALALCSGALLVTALAEALTEPAHG